MNEFIWNVKGTVHAVVVLGGVALTGLVLFSLPIALIVFAIAWN